MGRFFDKAPQKNQPVSRDGIAKGLRGMAYAIENAMCIGGSVTFSDFGAMIIDPSGGGFSQSALSSLQVITTPVYVLGQEADGTIGWVATVTHASQHPVS